MKPIFTGLLLIITCCSSAYADDGFTPSEVKLNKQIQDQLAKLQVQQQQQLDKLNTQIQQQLVKLQSDLQKQIQTSNSQIQGQLKKLTDQINKPG